jgi:hypothetical protein
MDIKNRLTSYKGNLQKAAETDVQIDSNLSSIQPKLTLLKLSKDELTQQMPKTQATDLSSHPVVAALSENMNSITNMRRVREDIVNRSTS